MAKNNILEAKRVVVAATGDFEAVIRKFRVATEDFEVATGRIVTASTQ